MTVGSQDTTGPMTRDELKDLACLGFSTDLTMQSFTTALIQNQLTLTHHTLPDFIMNRGGVSRTQVTVLLPPWLNRMLLPDTVNSLVVTHIRVFPMFIPAGSDVIATTLRCCDSCYASGHARISSTLQGQDAAHGITLRD